MQTFIEAGEDVMVIADMLHSCSNDSVARAALACIGGNFADRVHAAARRNGLNAGRFVAIVVRDFARRATDDSYASLRERMTGADQPLLRGLRHIIEPALEDGAVFFDDDPRDFGRLVTGGDGAAGCLRRYQ
jgi:hypothetical protein